jgi:predicted DNA-binding protein YlxM (UPF0122 family)
MKSYEREMTLEEIAKEFDITKERVRQIIHKALSKLRHPSRSCMLAEFLDDSPMVNNHKGRVRRHRRLDEIEEYGPNFWRRVL